jgi:hypothetical protein
MTRPEEEIAYVPATTLIGLPDLANSVVRVGDGRGFIIAAGDERYIVTAAHCLPFLPPAQLGRYPQEEIYLHLIGPEPGIAGRCLFADPVADIAVLGAPDGQEYGEQAGWFEAFITALPPFDVAPPPPPSRLRLGGSLVPFEIFFPGRILSLDGVWLDVTVRHFKSGALTVEPGQTFGPGMSGSPLVGATGVASTGSSEGSLSFGQAACLTNGLPGWLLRRLAST